MQWRPAVGVLGIHVATKLNQKPIKRKLSTIYNSMCSLFYLVRIFVLCISFLI